MLRGIRTHDLTRLSLKSYPLDHKSTLESIHGLFKFLSLQKVKFSAQRSRKTRDFEVFEIWKKLKYFFKAILKIGVDVCLPHTQTG